MAVAAFFDVDGTLIAKNSGPLYMRFLRRRGEIRRRDALRTVYYFVKYRLNLLDIEQALGQSSKWIRGRREVDVAAHCRLWYHEMVRQYLVPEMLQKVEEHRAAGHLIALLSSTTNYLADPLAEELGIEHLLVTKLVVVDGCFTGEVERPLCYADGKLYWARRFAEQHHVDLAQSFFYTDSVTDVPMLEIVGHPQIVNPDPILRRLARRRGWSIVPVAGARSAAAAATS